MNFFPDEKFSHKKYYNFLNIKWLRNNCFANRLEIIVIISKPRLLPDKLSALHFLKLKLKNQIQKIAQIFKRLAAAPCLFYIFEEQGFTQQKIQEKFTEAFVHTLPKALFIYLPIFAFILCLFHDKKKWWYFDHGIFTLHYFSFLLIYILIATILNFIDNLFDNFYVYPFLIILL